MAILVPLLWIGAGILTSFAASWIFTGGDVPITPADESVDKNPLDDPLDGGGLSAALGAIIDQWIIDIFSSETFQILALVAVVWVGYKIYKTIFRRK